MRKIDTLLFFLTSLLFSWLWFLPAFWNLANGATSFLEGLQIVFFSSQEQERLYGDTIDLQTTIWIFDHVQRILSGEGNSFLSEVYAPFGYDMGKHTGFAWGDVFLSLPLIAFVSAPGFYNAHVFLTLTLSYFGGMLLFRTAGASRLISIALAFATFSTTFTRQELLAGRPTQVYWIGYCLFFIAILQLLKKRVSYRWAILAGVFGAWSCIIYWFGGVAIGFCGALVLVFSWFFLPRIRIKSRSGDFRDVSEC